MKRAKNSQVKVEINKKKGKNRKSYSDIQTKVIKSKKETKKEPKPNTNRNKVCKLCKQYKTGKHMCKVGKNVRRRKNMMKFRKYLNALILSAFNSVAPSCISYMT